VDPADSPETLERFKSALPLVDAIARKVAQSLGRGTDYEDLRSFGQEGLLMAARRFDPSHEVPFRAYASYRVRGAMIDGIRKNAQLPRRVHEKLRMMSAADTYSESAAPDAMTEAARGDTRADAQRRLDEHLARMATAMAAGLVGETATDEAGEPITIARDRSPEEAVEHAELRALLERQIDELPEQEAELVRRHYFEGERFDHVAAELGLSKSWASRLHTRAIGRLTKRLRQKT
jgi:RNA polymerase sigma factor for flagellar operon FliA